MSTALKRGLCPVLRNVHALRVKCDFAKIRAFDASIDGLSRRNSTLFKSLWNETISPRFGNLMNTQASEKCSKCGDSVNRFKCSGCGALFVPSSSNYFDILAQSVTYDVREGELKRIYLQLQSEFHPDKYSQKSDDDKTKSEEISSLINKAYFTLNNPYERGMYILQLNNHPVNEGDIQLASGFLAEIMERNEELESVSSKEELDNFDSANEKDISTLSAKVSDAFKKKDYNSAKSDLNKMKYFLSIRNRLKEVQRGS